MGLLYYWLFMSTVVALAILLLILWRIRHPIEVLDLSHNKTKNQLELTLRNKKNNEYYIKSSLRLIQPTFVETPEEYVSEGVVMLKGTARSSVRETYELIGEDKEPLILGSNETKTIAYKILSTADLKACDNVNVIVSYGAHPDSLSSVLHKEVHKEVLLTIMNESAEVPQETVVQKLDDDPPLEYSTTQTLSEIDTKLKEEKIVDEVANTESQKPLTKLDTEPKEEKIVEDVSNETGIKKESRIRKRKTTMKKKKGEVLSSLENRRNEWMKKQEERRVKQMEKLAERRKRENERLVKQKERIAKQESARKEREKRWRVDREERNVLK